MTVDLDDGLLKLAPLDFAMARGRVNSTIGIDWRRRPARTSYDVRLHETPLSVPLKGWGVEEAGTTGKVRGRIELVGDGDTLHASLATASGRIAFVIPKGTFWTRNVQLAELDIGTFVQKMFEGRLKEPVQINCGLIAFTVRRGVAGADPILIDTAKNVILGAGSGMAASERQPRRSGRSFGEGVRLERSSAARSRCFSEPCYQIVCDKDFARQFVPAIPTRGHQLQFYRYRYKSLRESLLGVIM